MMMTLMKFSSWKSANVDVCMKEWRFWRQMALGLENTRNLYIVAFVTILFPFRNLARAQIIHHLTGNWRPTFSTYIKVISKSYTVAAIAWWLTFSPCFDKNFFYPVEKPGLPKPNRVPNLECIPCKQKFTNIGQLREHKKSHSAEETLKCAICDRPMIGKSQTNLLVHMFSHKNSEEKAIAVAAGERGAYKSRLSNYTKKITRIKKKPKRVGDAVAENRGTINKNKGNDVTRKRISCPICYRKFKNNAAWMSHLRAHNNQVPQECIPNPNSPRRSQRQALRRNLYRAAFQDPRSVTNQPTIIITVTHPIIFWLK